MSGIDEFSTHEHKYINELQKRFKGKMKDELYNDLPMFKRFLLARDYDINAAEEMLRKHLNWRELVDLDNILANYEYPEVGVYTSVNRLGFDKEGHPFIYCHFGNIDIKGLFKCLRKTELIKFVIYILEIEAATMKKQSLKLGKTIDSMCFILNFENFSIYNATSKATLETITQLIRMYNDNYPEVLKVAYIINVSFSFTLYWAVVKNFITGRTFDKIKVFGRDGWKEELLKAFDPEVLPMFLGGTRTDPDGNPMCNTFIKHGGKIPERYYAYRKSLCTGLINPKKLVIPRRSKAELTVEVLYPGSCIEWDFETKNRDIAFSLLYKENRKPTAEIKVMLLKQRIEADISTESRIFKCDEPGIYILQFDNSYSWLHQKEVYYKVTVSSPEAQFQKNEN